MPTRKGKLTNQANCMWNIAIRYSEPVAGGTGIGSWHGFNPLLERGGTRRAMESWHQMLGIRQGNCTVESIKSHHVAGLMQEVY